MRTKKKVATTTSDPDKMLDLRRKLGFLADRIGKVTITPRKSDYEFKFPHIITADEDTPGYASLFILIKRSDDEFWGFHILYVKVDDRFGTASAATLIHFGKHDASSFGLQFLKTFELVISRMSGIEHILGKIDILKQNTKWGKWLGMETINALLYEVYSQMWDLDVEIAEFTTIPKDILEEYKIILKMEFGD